mgnify:CR=1 FL=1
MQNFCFATVTSFIEEDKNYIESYRFTIENKSDDIIYRQARTAFAVSEMVLNELLYVALKENIIDKSEHYLGHYLKDYKNMIHPAREIRAKENVTHENVGTMWSVLVRLILVLFPD